MITRDIIPLPEIPCIPLLDVLNQALIINLEIDHTAKDELLPTSLLTRQVIQKGALVDRADAECRRRPSAAIYPATPLRDMEILYLHNEIRDRSAPDIPMPRERRRTGPSDLECVVDICCGGRVQCNPGCGIRTSPGVDPASGDSFELLRG
jgi:hypothetical protein